MCESWWPSESRLGAVERTANEEPPKYLSWTRETRPAYSREQAGLRQENPGSSMFFNLDLPINALLGKEGVAIGNIT